MISGIRDISRPTTGRRELSWLSGSWFTDCLARVGAWMKSLRDGYRKRSHA